MLAMTENAAPIMFFSSRNIETGGKGEEGIGGRRSCDCDCVSIGGA